MKTTKPSPPHQPSSPWPLVPREQPLYFQRNQTSQVFTEHQVSLAEASLPFLSPDVFLFLFIQASPQPRLGHLNLGLLQWLLCGLLSTALSPWVYLATIVKTFFLN